MNCDCGNYLDRDVNSAINIMLKFLKNREQYGCLSKNPLVDAVSFLALVRNRYSAINSPIRTRSDSGLAGSPSFQ